MTNYAAFADAMLAGFKAHARIDFPDDDDTVKRYCRWALAYIENELGFSIAGGPVNWTPETVAGTSAYQTPVTPVSSFTVTTAGADTSAEYQLTYPDKMQPPWLGRKDGGDWPADTATVLQAGFATPDDMPPNVEASVYRMAATLYENRESLTSLNMDVTPLWLRDLLSGAWI